MANGITLEDVIGVFIQIVEHVLGTLLNLRLLCDAEWDKVSSLFVSPTA